MEDWQQRALSLDDVARVFFPSSYAKRFRAEMPDYTGQISFVD